MRYNPLSRYQNASVRRNRMGSIRLRTIAVFVCLLASQSFANDSSGSVDGGNLILRRSPHIRMLREDLRISTRKVTVSYEFLNESNKSITDQIVFPIPPVLSCEQHVDAPSQFETTVNGQPIRARKIERRLPLTRRERRSDCTHTQTVYSWHQTFPSKQVVRITHSYAPGYDGGIADETIRRTTPAINGTCFDAGSANTALVEMFGQPAGVYNNVRYIWTSGNNWKNGIEDITLTVEHPEERSIISICGIGPMVQQAPGVLTTRVRNFRPHSELEVTIYRGN